MTKPVFILLFLLLNVFSCIQGRYEDDYLEDDFDEIDKLLEDGEFGVLIARGHNPRRHEGRSQQLSSHGFNMRERRPPPPRRQPPPSRSSFKNQYSRQKTTDHRDAFKIGQQMVEESLKNMGIPTTNFQGGNVYGHGFSRDRYSSGVFRAGPYGMAFSQQYAPPPKVKMTEKFNFGPNGESRSYSYSKNTEGSYNSGALNL